MPLKQSKAKQTKPNQSSNHQQTEDQKILSQPLHRTLEAKGRKTRRYMVGKTSRQYSKFASHYVDISSK